MNAVTFRTTCLGAITLAISLFVPTECFAYIGPGAGFAFLGSTFVFILSIGLAFFSFLLWPLLWAWRQFKSRHIRARSRAKRVVIVGLDGLEPKLVDKYVKEGLLPNIEALANSGAYSRLGTTLPALSPVAWSTFQTGVNPGAHNIFDFLTRDKRNCMPQLASTELASQGRIISLGKLKLKAGAPKLKITRKSKPFWKILGEHGVFSSILRVPISYPPEKFSGHSLAAMCTPDLRGTQGTFAYYTEDSCQPSSATTGGERSVLIKNNGTLAGEIKGPPKRDGSKDLTLPFSLIPDRSNGHATLKLGEREITLEVNKFSDWIDLEFRDGRHKVSGLCRFCLRQTNPGVALYQTPINIHPEKPALPISYPFFFSRWLSRKQGTYGTLGLMEDTWGRNELALDDQRFLEQTYLTHEERERMFFEILNKTKSGLVACVFDASDRIQHMFWRYLEPNHPSPLESEEFTKVIPEMYQRMDKLVGKVRESLKEDDTLIVLSDHGFSSFRRGININTWLYQNGYLALKDGADGSNDYFKDVDWSKTKAFGLGLSGLYINTRGRERLGTVAPEDKERLEREISAGLEALTDPKDGERAISRVYRSFEAYRGLYRDEAPDLIVGYKPGYRVSWESTTGALEKEVFSDNIKAWSGDHHVDPGSVPGIILTNKKLTREKPRIIDLAPTVLDLFGVVPPKYMEGSVIL